MNAVYEKYTRTQRGTVLAQMLDSGSRGVWLSRREIADLTEMPEPHVTVQLGKLRYEGYDVLRRAREKRGRSVIWEYQVVGKGKI